MRIKSKQKLPGTLPTCDLLENSYCVNTDTADKPKLVIYPSKISTRDPRFKERNNVAEKVIFSYKWMNDIGLIKEIKHLLMPSRVTVPLYTVDCDQSTNGDGESFWIEAYRKTEDEFPLKSKFHVVRYDSIYAAPADYRDGFITLKVLCIVFKYRAHKKYCALFSNIISSHVYARQFVSC